MCIRDSILSTKEEHAGMKTARLKSGGEFAIGKILCIGRNYAEHIRELGNETPEAQVLFMKPATSVIGEGEAIVIPPYSADCHHEAELALLIGTRGKDIPQDEALKYIAGYGVAIDLTLRDVQGELKKKGLPWEIAKGFDTACPLSEFTDAAEIPNPHDLRIRLTVNGELRQDGTTSMMIHIIPAIISHMSEIFTLEPGDIILTGTPAGVSRIVSGDEIVAEIPGVASLQVVVA
jgi:5-carboxymethyl-2-hydroxymuconate isomerase